MVMGEFTQEADLVVVGSGPGAYAAAFRAADLGQKVTMVSEEPRPGGVCLFRGCIPSKTLLHAARLILETRQAGEMGLTFSDPEIELDRLRAFKDEVVDKLAEGLVGLCEKRGVEFLRGRAAFEDSEHLRLHDAETEISHVKFRRAILASGSLPIALPGTEFGGRIMDAAAALALPDVPERLLVVGGSYVGLELGMVYAALGSRVTLVEMGDRIAAGADRDLVKPLAQRVEEIFHAIHVSTKVEELEDDGGEVRAKLSGEVEKEAQTFDRVLVAVGRKPRTEDLGLENTGVEVGDDGFVRVDAERRTADKHIFAIGDVAGHPMLAHKAMHEGKVAAEVIAGRPSAYDVRAVPAVVYTEPQLAWCGVTEDEAKAQGRKVRAARFPWSASGRAASMGVSRGLTKLILDPESEQILGMGIVGPEAGEMISEGVLAVEMGAVAEDLAMSIHPHPTLSEGEEEAAGAFLGSSTHVLPRQRRSE